MIFDALHLLCIEKGEKCKSRKETPQKLTQLSSRSHPRHLVGKRTAQKDITTDTTSDSQVNSNFPNRWSPVPREKVHEALQSMVTITSKDEQFTGKQHRNRDC